MNSSCNQAIYIIHLDLQESLFTLKDGEGPDRIAESCCDGLHWKESPDNVESPRDH